METVYFHRVNGFFFSVFYYLFKQRFETSGNKHFVRCINCIKWCWILKKSIIIIVEEYFGGDKNYMDRKSYSRKSCSRRISTWFITFPSGVLKDSTETAACAKAITDHLKVYCKSKDFAAELIIYASDKSSKNISSVGWHLHILLLALPGSTVRKEIEKFCTNKYRCPVGKITERKISIMFRIVTRLLSTE